MTMPIDRWEFWGNKHLDRRLGVISGDDAMTPTPSRIGDKPLTQSWLLTSGLNQYDPALQQ